MSDGARIYPEIEPPAQRGNPSCLSALTSILLVLIGGSIFLLAFFGFGIYRAGEGFVSRMENLFALPPQPTMVVDVRGVVVKQVQGLSELTTVLYNMQTVVSVSQDQTFGPFTIGQTKLLYVAQGEVRGGIDLSEIKQEDVNVVSDTIIIRLPPPKMIDKKIDVDKSYVYDFSRGGIFAPEGIDFQTRAERQALSQIVQAACDNQVLEKANEEAETAIGALLSASGYRSVTVITQSPSPDQCPAVPVPIMP
jgi:hypothetical protein